MSAPAAAGASAPGAAGPPAIPQYALVIVSHKNGNIRSTFMGQESVYIERASDGKTFRSYPANADTNEKRLAAAKSDPNFTRYISSRVVLKRMHDNSSFKYTLQRVVPASKWGFPKGELLPGETPKQGVIREFLEETGFALDENKLILTRNVMMHGKNYTIYYYKASDAEKVGIEAAYGAKIANREGELFNARFFSIPQIVAKNVEDILNRISSVAFDYYLADIIQNLQEGTLFFGGAKKRRSTKRNENKKRKLTRRK